ncbi:DUF4082 domain-containing protein [Halorhabdus sp. CUG00001]|uniref:DUF4082 domain-containing protein n=1 Tax=Halorhabdus sp. CUG00001 TaxID=2600297 RepID=UPI00131B8062|nr:DUF4082 domain-containing protein [Halorhabdus sp. CUG00001]
MTRNALALTFVLVVSLVAGPLALAGPTAATPQGFVGVPDGQITQDVPSGESIPLSASDLQGNVLIDSHADSTEVILTTPSRADEIMGSDSNVLGSGEMAIVIRDNQHDAGREIAIDAGQLRTALGHSPEMIYGTHSSGETWQSPAAYEDGYLRFSLDHFSSNTVTFSGEVSISGTYADSSQVSYDLTDLDAASDPVVNLTGKTNTEWDNVSATAVGVNHTSSISVAGNNPPTNGSGGDPQIKVTANVGGASTYNPFHDEGDGSGSYKYQFMGDDANDDTRDSGMQINPSTSGEVTEITVHVGGTMGSDYGGNVDVYISQEATQDGDFTDGTKVATWDPTWSTGAQTITFDTPVNVENGTTYWIQFHTPTSDNDGTADALQIEASDEQASEVWFERYLSDGGGFTHDRYANVDVPIDGSVDGLSVSDGDGNSATFGDFTDGETKTRALNLSTATSSLDFQGKGGGTIDYTLVLQEHTKTEDVGVELNGNWLNHTGTLADGETASLSGDASWLQSGTNRVNVSMPSLSADAPPMQVGLDYSHDASDDLTVEYTGEKFTERYNVSKQYASDRQNPTLTIPFADTAVAMRDLEYRVNGGTWQTLTTADYSLDNTTLTAQLPDVSAGDEITVRANASKVAVENAEITVTDPTAVGERLDTAIDIPSTSGDVAITWPDNSRLRYAYNETYEGADAYHVDGSATLQLPNAGQGDSLRVSSLPVQVAPQSGDVTISVVEPTTTEPVLSVESGSQSGDEVSFTHLEATDGAKYILYSQTNDVVRDSGTANSPVTLVDDDSAEVLAILLDDSGASSSSGDDSSATLAPVPASDSFPWLLILGAAGVIVLGVVVWRGPDDVGGSVASTSAGVAAWLQSHPFATAVLAVVGGLGLIVSGLIAVPSGTGVVLLVSMVPLGTWVALRRWGDQSLVVWAGVTLIALVLGLQLLGTDVVALIFDSQAGIIATIGLIGLAYYALKTYQTEAGTPDSQTTVEFDLESGGDGS